jgi:hypothetical protein
VRVVHGDEERRLLGDVGAEPVQAVQHGERAGAKAARIRLAGAQLEHRAGQGRGALERRRSSLAGRERLEELAHHAERECPLELGAARPGDAHAALARRALGGQQQLGLADAAGTFDQQQRAASVPRRVQACADVADLPVAVQQPSLACLCACCHGANVPAHRPPDATATARR